MLPLKRVLKRQNKMRFLAHHFQRKVGLHKNRKKIASVIGRFSPKVDFDSSNSAYSFLIEAGERQSNIEKLNKDGIIVFNDPFLSKEKISSIFEQLEDKCLFEPYSKKSGYKLEDIPSDCSCSHYERNELVQIPEIMELANDPGLLKLAQEYLGSTPTISNINLWWGTYRGGEAVDNELFHRDKDDYDFLKFFIYLTDTDEDDYNIVYVKDTLHSKKALDKIRYTDQEIVELFGRDSIVHAVGAAGTGFIAANYGVHKGALPKEVGRKTALLQIQYSIRSIAGISYEPVDLIGRSQDYKKYNSWINRCLFKAH